VIAPDQVTAGLEVLGRFAVGRVPRLREAVGRWVRKPLAEPQTYSLADLRVALEHAGVKAGRDLLVHSSWAGMGRPQATPRELLKMLAELIGPASTLLVPAHAVEKTQGGVLIYDVEKSPSRMGMLSESIRRFPGVRRGPFPVAPVFAVGPGADEYTKDHRVESSGTPWGKGSPYWLLGERGGQVLVIGLDFVRTLTLMHCAFDVLLDDNPIADFYEPIKYLVVRGGAEEHWYVRRQRRQLERHLATFTFRKLALKSGTVRETRFRGVSIAVVDAKGFLDWHLELARRTGLPYWGFRRRRRS
jgi:aminoglycoside 3-N-acetyltransferase